MKESTWEQQPAFTVETVSLDEWALYKDLWLDALTTDPQAFAYSLDTVSQWDEVAWKTDIQKSFRENACSIIIRGRSRPAEPPPYKANAGSCLASLCTTLSAGTYGGLDTTTSK